MTCLAVFYGIAYFATRSTLDILLPKVRYFSTRPLVTHSTKPALSNEILTLAKEILTGKIKKSGVDRGGRVRRGCR
jgi:hypothetical protein